MDTFLTIITEVGFPVAAVIAMAWFIYKIYKQSVKREDLLMKEITENRLVITQAVETISLYGDRLKNIEESIDSIESALFNKES